MHQLNNTKRARVTSNAIHLPGSRILHYVRFRYPIVKLLLTKITGPSNAPVIAEADKIFYFLILNQITQNGRLLYHCKQNIAAKKKI
jgi:hypothetical protein